MSNFSCVINNSQITETITLAQFNFEDEEAAALLLWDGGARQVCLESIHKDLDVMFEGQLYNQNWGGLEIKNPNPGSFIRLDAGDKIYFQNDNIHTPSDSYVLDLNASSLRLDDVTLNRKSYQGGIKFNLHANYAGTYPNDRQSFGKIVVLCAVDVLNENNDASLVGCGTSRANR